MQELTPQNLAVLRLLAENMTTQQIANRLGISHDRAKHHVQHVRVRLGLARGTPRENIIQEARNQGLII